MERVSEPILGSQETSSQEPYHIHTLMTFIVCIGTETNYYSSTNLGDSNHLSDGTPSKKSIVISAQKVQF